MALNFPSNPYDGQLYPDPAIPGAQQYVYNDTKGTWLTVFKGVETVLGINPIFITGTDNSPVVNIKDVTTTESGAMTAADKVKLDSLSAVSLPSGSTYTTIDNISSGFNGVQRSFQIASSGSPFSPIDAKSMLVFIGGVIQLPQVGFTISGSNIIFSSAPLSGATFYGISLT
jgi:hypothetical protein